MFKFLRSILTSLAAISLVLTACGGEEASVAEGSSLVVVTTNILGDVVEELVGDQLVVETIMPSGADPHVFQASAKQVDQMTKADVLVVNGASFEEGLLDVISSVESDGVAVFEAMSVVRALEFGSDDHDDHAGHDHSGVDPHFFTDPIQMIEVVEGLTEFLIEKISDIDADLVRSNAESYIGELEELHSEISALFSEIPTSKRVLVTNHQVFGYFAEQYGFEVVGTVIPSSSTLDSASAKGLTELIDVIKKYEVTAIFADVASSNVLASTLADEVGDIQVIDLYSESLGEQGSGASTYLGMIRSNAKLISEGLTEHDHDH